METAPIMRTFFIGLFVFFGTFSVKAQTFVDKRKTLSDTVFNVGDVIKLPMIFFDLNKATLLPFSIDSLKAVYAFLTQHPSFIVEISNHSDQRYPKTYSTNLTYARAKVCADTLIKMGIDTKRIVAQGFGNTKPLIDTADIQKMKTREEQEKAYQINRRVELKVLSTQYRPVKTIYDTVFNAGDLIKVPDLVFVFDKAILSPASADSLKLLADFLKSHPSFVVEIGNHTDLDCEYCSSKLTVSRSESCRDSLVKMGIDKERLFAKGYGTSRPIVLDRDIVLPSGKIIPKGTSVNEVFRKYFSKDKNDIEFMARLNRRTELIILRTDYRK